MRTMMMAAAMLVAIGCKGGSKAAAPDPGPAMPAPDPGSAKPEPDPGSANPDPGAAMPPGGAIILPEVATAPAARPTRTRVVVLDHGTPRLLPEDTAGWAAADGHGQQFTGRPGTGGPTKAAA